MGRAGRLEAEEEEGWKGVHCRGAEEVREVAQGLGIREVEGEGIVAMWRCEVVLREGKVTEWSAIGGFGRTRDGVTMWKMWVGTLTLLCCAWQCDYVRVCDWGCRGVFLCTW